MITVPIHNLHSITRDTQPLHWTQQSAVHLQMYNYLLFTTMLKCPATQISSEHAHRCSVICNYWNRHTRPDRQTQKQKNILTDKCTNSQTDRQTDQHRLTDTHWQTQTVRQTDMCSWCHQHQLKETHKQANTHTHTHAHIQTDKYTNICFRCYVTHNSEIFHYKHDNIVIKHLHSLHVISMHYTAV